MSYCRFGESDVYMYPSVQGGIVCCGCRFISDNQEKLDRKYNTPEHALAHLREHIAAGHRVPQHAIDRLERESKGMWMCHCYAMHEGDVFVCPECGTVRSGI